MATTRKGWRTLIVDGESYRWMVGGDAKYWDDCTRKEMRFIVESGVGALLVVALGRPRLDYWVDPWVVDDLGAIAPLPEDLRPVTPKEVADEIRLARGQGWDSRVKAKAFFRRE